MSELLNQLRRYGVEPVTQTADLDAVPDAGLRELLRDARLAIVAVEQRVKVLAEVGE